MLATKKFKPNTQDNLTIPVGSEAQLSKELDAIASTLGNMDNNWEKRADAMRRLKGLVRGGAHRSFPSLFAEQLSAKVKDPLSKQFGDLRSTLVKEAAQCIEFLMDNLDIDMLDTLADTLVESLLKMLGTTNKVLQNEGHNAMKAVLCKAHVTRGLQRICACALTSKMPSQKQLCVEYIGIVIQHAQNYTQAFFDRSFDDIEKVLKKLLSDGDPNVRTASRATFWTYYLTWESRGTAFIKTVDDNVKKNLIKEDPRSNSSAINVQQATLTSGNGVSTPSQNLGTLGTMPESGTNTPASKSRMISSTNRTPVSPSVNKMQHSHATATMSTPGNNNQLAFMSATGTLDMDLSDDDDNEGNKVGTKTISQQITPIKGSVPQNGDTAPFTPKRNPQIDRLISGNTGMTPYTSPRMKLERNVIPKILNNINSSDTSTALSQVTTLTRLRKALEDLNSYDVTPHANLITLFLKDAMGAPEDALLILEVIDILLKKYPGSIVYSLDEILPFVLSRRTEHPALCASIEGAVAAEYSQEILVPAATRALAAAAAATATTDSDVHTAALAITEFLGKLLDRFPDFFRDASKLKAYIPTIASIALDNASEDARVAATHLLCSLFDSNRAEFTSAFLSLPQGDDMKLKGPLIGLVPDLGIELNKRTIEKSIPFMTKDDATELAKTADPSQHAIFADPSPIKSAQQQQEHVVLSPKTQIIGDQEKKVSQGSKSTNTSTNDSMNGGSTGARTSQRVFTAKEVEEAAAKDERPFPTPVKKVLYMLGKAATCKVRACPEAFRELNSLLSFSKQQQQQQQQQQIIDSSCVDALLEALCLCAGADQETRMRMMALNGLKDVVSSYSVNVTMVKPIVLLCMDVKKRHSTTIVGDGEKAYSLSMDVLGILEKKCVSDLFNALLEICESHSKNGDGSVENWTVEYALGHMKSLCRVVGNDFLDKSKEDFVGVVSTFVDSEDVCLRKEGMACLAQSCAVMQAEHKDYVDFIKSKLSNFQEKLLDHYIKLMNK